MRIHYKEQIDVGCCCTHLGVEYSKWAGDTYFNRVAQSVSIIAGTLKMHVYRYLYLVLSCTCTTCMVLRLYNSELERKSSRMINKSGLGPIFHHSGCNSGCYQLTHVLICTYHTARHILMVIRPFLHA